MLLTSCGTAPTASRRLPAYEPPIAKSDFQTVRTTAYTHTESDHLELLKSQRARRTAAGRDRGRPTRGLRRARVAGRFRFRLDYQRASYAATRRCNRILTPQKRTVTTLGKDETRPKKVTTTVLVRPTDWERGGRLVALAGRDRLSPSVDRTDLQGRRLRLGTRRPQHDRSLHGEPRRHEHVGRARQSRSKFCAGAIRKGVSRCSKASKVTSTSSGWCWNYKASKRARRPSSNFEAATPRVQLSDLPQQTLSGSSL